MNPVPSNKGLKILRLGSFTYGKLVGYMLDGVYSMQELADLTGLHYVTVQGYCRELHAAKAAFICEWRPDEHDRDIIKIYKIGREPDAVRRKLTCTERTRRYRAKKRGRALQASLTFTPTTPFVESSTIELRSEHEHATDPSIQHEPAP